MKRAIAAIGACAGLLTVGAVLTAGPAGADCASVSARDDCAVQRDATRTETVTVTRTKTTTTTTTSTTTLTTTVTVTATRTGAAAGAVAEIVTAPADGPVVAARPN